MSGNPRSIFKERNTGPDYDEQWYTSLLDDPRIVAGEDYLDRHRQLHITIVNTVRNGVEEDAFGHFLGHKAGVSGLASQELSGTER